MPNSPIAIRALDAREMPLVTVVIPAFNASATIDETLHSVRAQSYDNLEIIVVDDGSADDTVARVEQHIRADPRLRLVRQANAGVAAARNKGIVEAAGDYVAPVDSDDLWHPEKIERQMAVMRADPEVGLVYTWYSIIDEHGEVLVEQVNTYPDAWQFAQLCHRNVIGNGSSALMRREAALRMGGYDSGLRQQRAQGCEDLKLYLQIAEHYPVAVAPWPLTGYRQLSGNMSSDGQQMLRSFDIVAREFVSRLPHLAGAFASHRLFMLHWLISRSLSGKRPDITRSLVAELFKAPKRLVLTSTASTFRRFVRRRLHKLARRIRGLPPRPYLEADPAQPAPDQLPAARLQGEVD
jgi:hypothetical protein